LAAPAAENSELLFQPRPENLASVLQEVLTGIVRLRENRESVTDAQRFRAQIKESIDRADRDAKQRGYSPDTVRAAVFAVVALVDESVLNRQVPIFADWARKPLQEEYFGVAVAGEMFFENLKRMLAQTDSTVLADLLEVYQLCLLLGFRGRYGVGAQGELASIMDAIATKIRRVRGVPAELSPAWALPQMEKLPVQSDPWGRRLLFMLLACLGLALLLFIGFSLSLSSGMSAVTTLSSER
jgi:type VI secretion system protein ImpK